MTDVTDGMTAGGTSAGPRGTSSAPVAVVGAAGKTGRAVLRALRQRGHRVRALVRRPEQAAGLRDEGADEVAVVDLVSGAGLHEAFDGAAAVYHLAPNTHPAEVAIARHVLAAARATGLPHLTFHSVLHPDDASMPHHLLKGEVERLLRSSGLSWTVLRPAAYTQNLLAGVAQGELVVPYRLDAPFTLVDLDDVAVAAAMTLTDPVHSGATYDLAGPEVVTVADVAQTAEDHIGRPVGARRIAVADWRRDHGSDLDPWALETLTRMFTAYDREGLVGDGSALAALLGRRPTTVTEVVVRELAPGGPSPT